ncbi:hypothetical protein CGLO_13978 [Colletotrichum gloeosporioides Cg-14]|uniref:Uncharacterized protein n=1 Tax=Colletotrichum gloeosporioides (strain Cg-14) TaxID=1237896 RepID=T0K2K6_COLGC|nr:hypothetical protein CGLO_13978 [Colletotrichum gloeosporioides Cg-14]
MEAMVNPLHSKFLYQAFFQAVQLQ